MDMEQFEGWALRPAEYRRHFSAADHLGPDDAVLVSVDDVDPRLAARLGTPRTFWLTESLMAPVSEGGTDDEADAASGSEGPPSPGSPGE